MRCRLLVGLLPLLPAIGLAQDSAPPPVRIGIPHSCIRYYPPVARRDGVEGTVELAFTIKTDGSIKDITVAKSSGSNMLDNAAYICALHWLYRPASLNGVPVAVPWHAAVVFALADPQQAAGSPPAK